MAFIDDEDVVVPSRCNAGLIVAVCPTKKSADKFWLAEILSVVAENPLEYKIKFFDFTKTTKKWSRRVGGFGVAPHTSIIYAGITFTDRGQLPSLVKKRLAKIVP